jgi:hypothetical protein
MDFTAHGTMEALSEFGLCTEAVILSTNNAENRMLFTLALKTIMR